MVELAQIDQFFDDGFFIAKQQIIEKELEDLREAFDHLRTKAESNNEIYNLRYNFMGNGDWDSWGVNDIFHPSLYDKRFDDYLANTHVLGIVSKILGDELRFGAAHALWGPKKVDYNLYWHRDGGQLDLFTPSGKSNHVQYNLALDYDACFYVIPGSHRRPLSRQEYDEARKCGNGSLPGEVSVI
jgi:ectoine hydroxylase-related dioxygenase (phytanoyl-CoA dioxygenase family)